jgi:hypothetical protein
VYSRDTGRGNSREGGSECTGGTWVGATVGRGGARLVLGALLVLLDPRQLLHTPRARPAARQPPRAALSALGAFLHLKETRLPSGPRRMCRNISGRMCRNISGNMWTCPPPSPY